MNYSTKIKWSFISGIIASILWVIGDVFVAGFDVNPADYPLFSQTYANEVDVNLAVLMLEGSTQRLMFGGLIASMSAFLFLPGVWLACQFFKDQNKPHALITYYILIISVVLMPLGHSDFFYSGELFKAIYYTDAIAHPYLLEMSRGFTEVLYIAWGTAIIVMLIGWLLFSVLVFMKKTTLPRWAGLLSPVFLTFFQIPIRLALPQSEFRGYLISAGFNLSYLIFFILVLVLFRKQLRQSSN